MAFTGFGKRPAVKKKNSAASGRRAEAASELESMRSSGLPEFAVFIRARGQKGWLPVGSLAVNRSNQISRAIYDNEADLRQGAFRLFPRLRKQQANLEYGYRLKEFTDEPVVVAERPAEVVPNFVQKGVATIRETVTGLFNKAQ
ncbi:MAG: HHL1-like protein [Cyanophyceae cyanobacterium]